jgi:hypothetical protein
LYWSEYGHGQGIPAEISLDIVSPQEKEPGIPADIVSPEIFSIPTDIVFLDTVSRGRIIPEIDFQIR